jgi:hypothetical protein
VCTFFFRCSNAPRGPRPPVWRSTMTLRQNTVIRAPMDKLSARRRDFYLKTYTQKRQPSMPHRGSNPKSQQASGRSAEPRHKPRGNWD